MFTPSGHTKPSQRRCQRSGPEEGASQAKAKPPVTHLIAFEGHTTGAGCGTLKALGWGAAMPPWGLCSCRRGTGPSPAAAMFPFIFW